MLKAVLFDLDGTLLDIDIEPFLRDYFALLGPVLAGLLGENGDVAPALEAVMTSTQAMAGRHPGSTNREVFNRRFSELTGVDLALPSNAAAVEAFYREEFPSLAAGRGPRPGARDAVTEAETLGLMTALATNPIFPRSAIDERARWAGVDTSDFSLVTSYETMTACKPSREYFREIATMLDVGTGECLMVGDDPVLDLAAADVGMKTFYVGRQPGVADYQGTLQDLAGSLGAIAGRDD